MGHKRLKSTGTQEMHLRKISFRRVAELGEKVKTESSIGWECLTPRKGLPYQIQLQNGAIFRTSPIREMEKTEIGVVIRTANSIYEVRYLQEEDRD
jgi:hypothetical protein